jgi:hypothetical protein
MKRFIILMALFAVMVISGSWMMEGCQEKLAPLSSIVVTATETSTPIPSTQVSDFQTFGTTANTTGVIINPTLTNLVAGSQGFTNYIPAAAPVNGVINPTAVVQSYGDAALGDTYAARINATWTDGAGYGYPAAQLFAYLYKGQTWYVLPAGLTGVKFYLNVVTMTSTGAPVTAFDFQIPLSTTVQNNNFGTCTANCYNNWSHTLPTTTSGYVLETIPFSALSLGAFATSATSCSNTVFQDGCNTNYIMGLEWTAQSESNPGNYAVDFRVDDVTFY